jgi:hypothetical protein
MKNKNRAFWAVAVLVLAQLSCNMPGVVDGGETTQEIPSPNQTLTALFAITPPSGTATATLPPVITATQAGSNPTAADPTATSAPASNVVATQTPVANATAIARATATSTRAVAVATATIPSARPGTQVIANFLNTAPTLDGDWSEWKDVTKEYPANNVVFGRQNWTGEDDLSSSFHVGWDNSYLYIAVKVRDDKYVQNASGENIYKGDSIELLIDTKLREDYYYNELSPDDFQLGINPGRPDVNGTREAYLWFPAKIKGAKGDVKIASRSENGVYRVEAAIPWSVLEMTPTAGMHVGFAISVSDNDNAGENVQQTMVSSVPGRSLLNPTTWGDLQLVK